ncbi:thermonuclease family protein [Candidatus Bipolaricaulota bacterium]|nr:thermonuclease family protein [Candidatus Bipolaricaulota bacterium]
MYRKLFVVSLILLALLIGYCLLAPALIERDALRLEKEAVFSIEDALDLVEEISQADTLKEAQRLAEDIEDLLEEAIDDLEDGIKIGEGRIEAGTEPHGIRVCDSVTVKDGDTFYLCDRSIRLNFNKIRPLGVDAPKEEDLFYQKATDYLKVILDEEKEQNLWIQVPEPHDESLSYNRVLALVYLDPQQEKSLNEMILEAGWGKIYKFPKPLKDDESLRTRFFNAQISAALAGRGIWQDKKGVFIGGILYWGNTEIVALVNRGEAEVPLENLILRDEYLEEEHEKDTSKPYNLLSDDSWQTTAVVIPPGGVVSVFRIGGRFVWDDDGDTGFLYYVHEKEPDTYSYKGPG